MVCAGISIQIKEAKRYTERRKIIDMYPDAVGPDFILMDDMSVHTEQEFTEKPASITEHYHYCGGFTDVFSGCRHA